MEYTCTDGEWLTSDGYCLLNGTISCEDCDLFYNDVEEMKILLNEEVTTDLG
jgi:hypothetical protein